MKCGKIIYQTKGDAKQVLQGLGKSKPLGTSGSVYFCTDCEGWHITGGGFKIKGRRRNRKFTNKNDKQETEFANVDNKLDIRKNQFLTIKKYY